MSGRDSIVQGAEETTRDSQIDPGYSSQAAREIAEVRANYEAKLQKVETRVREDLEKTFKNQQSDFYKGIEAQIRDQLSKETASRDSALSNSRMELENKFNIDYEAKFRAMQGSFEDKFGDMVSNFEGLMGQARDQWEAKWASELERNSAEWANKWALREREWLTKERERERSRAEQEDKFSRQYRRLLEEHMTKVDTLLEEQGEADLSLLDTRIKELETSRQELSKAQEDFDVEVQRKYGEWVHRLKESHAESLKSLEEANARNEETLQKALSHEREVHAGTLARMQREHAKQLEIAQSTVAEERKELSKNQQVFEETLRSKYQSMVETLQEKVRMEQEAQMRRALDLLEKAARSESERSRQMYDMQSKAEAASSAKFQNLVSELRETWEAEEATRAKKLDQRLRNHYETVIEHMQSQLDAALKLNDDADKQWMEDVEARNRQQVATMQAYEEKCRRLYQTRLTEYIERTDSELAEYEEMLLQAGSKAAVQSARFESHLRRVKLSCSKWRADYQKEVEQRYEQTAQELDKRYTGEISALTAQLAEAQGQLAKMDERVSDIHARSDYEISQSQLGDYEYKDKIDDTRKLAARQKELYASLQKLWSGLRTPAAVQVEILESLVNAADPSANMVTLFQHYNEQLSAQLPLIQMSTRREYLKFRIKTLRRFASEGGSSPNKQSDVKMEELEEEFQKHMAEFGTLDQRLEQGISGYNERFGLRFLFDGKDYLEVIHQDIAAEQALSDIDEKLKKLEAHEGNQEP